MTLISDFLPPADVLYLAAAGLLLLLFMEIIYQNRSIDKKRYKKLFELLDKQAEKERVALERTKGICGDCGSFLSHNAARCKICGSEQPFDQVQLISLMEDKLDQIYISKKSVRYSYLHFFQEIQCNLIKEGGIDFKVFLPFIFVLLLIIISSFLLYLLKIVWINSILALLLLFFSGFVGLFPYKIFNDIFFVKKSSLKEKDKILNIIFRVRYVFENKYNDLDLLITTVEKYDSFSEKTKKIYKNKIFIRFQSIPFIILAADAYFFFFMAFQVSSHISFFDADGIVSLFLF